MIKGFFNIPWFVWAVFALIVAIVYVLVWPQKVAAEASGFRFFIVRWGHALRGGWMYISFLMTTFMVK